MEHKEREGITNFLCIEEVSFHSHASRNPPLFETSLCRIAICKYRYINQL